MGLLEEVGMEEDIMKWTKELNTKDCVLDKKRLRCVEHHCVLKVMNVSNKKWQWVERKKNSGMLIRNLRSIYM